MEKNITFYGYAFDRINGLLSESPEPVEKLAKILSRSKEYASDILSERLKPTNEDIYTVCSYYGITIDDFLNNFGRK